MYTSCMTRPNVVTLLYAVPTSCVHGLTLFIDVTHTHTHTTSCPYIHTPSQLLFKEDCSVDDLIDVIEGNRRYVKCLYVYNKVRWLRSTLWNCHMCTNG